MSKQINLNEYLYPLSQEKIAVYPLDKRDESKLLVYKNGAIAHEVFNCLSSHLPDHALLIFNDTKVIPARLHFTKGTGATIEIFLLNPIEPSSLLMETMNAMNTCTWKCTIGNLKRWQPDSELQHHVNAISIQATLLHKEEGIVKFTWNGSASFAEVIATIGETPLPPYLKRKAEDEDKTRYQTIYSQHEGAVAAPTAGLHFTNPVLKSLQDKRIETDFLTLHVSAGTFQPIKTDDAYLHTMHQEQIIITRENIENLLKPDKFVIPVGTTSMRTLESLYWFGIKLIKDDRAKFVIFQYDPYLENIRHTKEESLTAVIRHMDQKRISSLVGQTSIYIVPGYTFRICEGLITNFHQPGSTLILLVAAFVGSNWKRIYQQALDNQYRFLSYGDSSLLLP